jgi:hypothetical protein
VPQHAHVVSAVAYAGGPFPVFPDCVEVDKTLVRRSPDLDQACSDGSRSAVVETSEAGTHASRDTVTGCHWGGSSDSALSFRRPSRHDRLRGRWADERAPQRLDDAARLPTGRSRRQAIAPRGMKHQFGRPDDHATIWHVGPTAYARRGPGAPPHIREDRGPISSAGRQMSGVSQSDPRIGRCSFPRKTHPDSQHPRRSQHYAMVLQFRRRQGHLPRSFFDLTSFPRKTAADVTHNSACRRVGCSLSDVVFGVLLPE